MDDLGYRFAASSTETTRLDPAAGVPPVLSGLTEAPTETPRRVLDLDVFQQRVEQFRDQLLSSHFEVAYSVKTNPDHRILQRAAQLGLWCDAITTEEAAAAVAAGLGSDRLILNGPAKWFPERPAADCHAFFADSLDELVELQSRMSQGFNLSCRVVGVRLTTPGSRFGIDVTDRDSAAQTAESIAWLCERLGASWGLSVHLASSAVGADRWVAAVRSALTVSQRLSSRLGPAHSVDLGGGFHPRDLTQVSGMLSVLSSHPVLVRAPEVFIEPGKCLIEPAGAVLARVVSLRNNDVVLDASRGELPEAAWRTHPVWLAVDGGWQPLKPGTGRLLGRSCMEHDVLATNCDASVIHRGQLVAFADAGGYDASMAYPFGRGRSADV